MLKCFCFLSVLLAVGACQLPVTHAQSTAPVEFDVVSIKRNVQGAGSAAGIRLLPDGTLIMTNQPIRSVILNASPVPTREVLGIPDWVNVELYDLTAKPPAGSRPEQRPPMWRALFADRMKLVAHVEERERNTFALVLDRRDGRLGPGLTPSTLDCSPRTSGSAPPPQSQTPPSLTDFRNRCGTAMTATSLVSGGITMDQLAQSLAGLAGGLVTNRTGLQGTYALTLTYSAGRGAFASADAGPPDGAPELFTALKEQLGLKLQTERTMVPVFVVDYIERPSDN
jgi:uncharacterized protein (TIGR03435 family)